MVVLDIMEDEEIQADVGVLDPVEVTEDTPRSTGIDRRGFVVGSVSAAVTLGLTLAGFKARAQDAVDDKERQAAYEKVRKEGLARIERKENYTLKFDGRFKGGHDILAVRFKKGKSALFILKYAGEKLLEKKQYAVSSYSGWLDHYKELGFKVSELD